MKYKINVVKKINLLLIIYFLIQTSKMFSMGEPEFIKAKGIEFFIGEKKYCFIGTNFWYGSYLCINEEDKKRLIRELDRLKELGINNLRILAASEKSYLKNTLQPVFQSEPNLYNENLLEGLDFLLNEMSKRNMYAVIILNNYWEWSGGFASYNDWTNYCQKVDPDNEIDGWKNFMIYSASFYQNEKGNELYRNYIKLLLTRKNKFNDKYYSEDPTIMAWQLANEPRPGYSEESIENQSIYYEWINETAKFIKSIDNNHLVSTGSEGVIGSLQVDSIYFNAHNSEYIDYLTFHIWPKNWNWYDPQNPDNTFYETKEKVRKYFNEHLSIAKKLNKPIVLEEFGLSRDYDNYDINSTTKYRDNFYKYIFDLVEDSINSNSPIAGTNFWAWAGEGRSVNSSYKWEIGNPFTGDPPHEPQGLYSVFDTDVSTIEIIKQHAIKINKYK